MKKTINISGSPSYITKSEESDLFYLVETLTYDKDNLNQCRFNFKEDEKGEVIELRKGLDIIETGNRRTTISFRVLKNRESLPRVMVDELKKHAEIANQDYVSNEL